MSVNQSRAERTQGQLRKPSRSGSSGQQRGSIGSGGLGKGGSFAPSPISSSASTAAPSSISPSLSTNRSFEFFNNLSTAQRFGARIELFGAAPTLPVPSIPKQQQQARKDASGVQQSNSVEAHPLPQAKRDVSIPVPSASVIPMPKSSVLPISGMPPMPMPMPMPMPFQPQQPQIPPQLGGPSPQMQSPGLAANSLQMTMTLPVGNPQVAQQIYVPGIQPHFVQQQAMMHQGQGLGFAPPISHQLSQQLGNMGMAISSQFPQQHMGKFSGPRKTTVKITHPETHEVLRLDKRTDSSKDGVSSGQRSLSNVIPQAQPIPTYSAAHQMNYYPPMQQNSYSPSPLIFTTTTVPLTSGLIPMSSQAPKYSYPVSQSGQNLSFMKSSMANAVPGGKPALSKPEAVNLEGLPVSTSLPHAVRINVRGLQSEKVGASSGTPPVVISMPFNEAEPVKSVKTVADATISCHKINETSQDGPAQQLNSGSEPLLTLPVLDKSSAAAPPVLSPQRMLSEASSTTESRTGDSGSVQSGNDLDVSSPEGAKLSSPKPTKSSYAGELISQEGCPNTENTEALLASDLATSSAWPCNKAGNVILSEAGATEPFKVEIMPAASGLSGSILEKEASQGTSLSHADSFGSAPDGVSIEEDVPSEVTTSLSPMMDGTNSRNLGTSSCLVKEVLDVMRDEMFDVTKHEKSEVSDASLQDSSDNNVHQPSTTKKSSKLSGPVMLLKQDDSRGNDGKVKFIDYHEADNKQFSSSVVGTKEGETSIANEQNKTIDASLDPTDSGTVPNNDIRSANDDKDKVDIFTTKCEIKYSEDIGLTDSGVTSIAAPVPSPSLLVTQKSESEVVGLHSGLVSATSLRQKEKPSLETSKPKITTARKKKRKEILSKADAAGTLDLYNAYTGPEEMHETVSNSENIDNSTTDTKSAHVDFTNKDVAASEENGQTKAELDDWEDAADISIPKLKTSEHGHSADGHDYDGYEASTQKKYSRDFLMTLSQQFSELPVGFEIGSDIADALMSTPLGKSPCPSPGRIIDRPSGASRVDRRMVGNLDDEKWTKSPSFGLGRDRLDIGHGAAIVSLRPGQGVSHGVLRNPRGQASNQFGGILSGPTQSVASQGGMPRDADRWQRARGLMPSPQTPLQAMHKAERKYEVGKAVDQEEGKQRQLKAILNKLTPQNFEKLFAQVKEVNIDSAATLTGVISQIFDKALMEPTFCEMYANFCFHLSDALPDFNEDNELITFKRLLLNKCQEEFERGEREQAEANKVEEEGEIKQSEEEREEKRLQARRRMLGNIRLIGELYKKRMLTERIMHECIKKLLGQYQNPDEEDVEALCKLMSTIGEMIDHPKAKEHMDAYFDMMAKLSTNQKLSSRVRFMLRDAIDLRKNKWQQRRKVEGPKKIEEVHRDAAQERQAQSSRLARGPVISNIPRRGQVVDYGSRGSTPLTSPNSQQVGSLRGLPTQARGYGTQDVRLDDRHHFETRTVSLPLPQRSTDDDSITLGPQGGLARGMSTRGHPSISISNVLAAESPAVGEHRRLTSGPNGTSYMADRFSGTTHDQVKPHDRTSYYGSRDFKISDHTSDRSVTSILPAGRTHGTSDSSLTSASEIRTLPEEESNTEL
ncbi:hypothetical protein BHE74_00007276 [Ensete ventricosum]|nr:hypothetical protein BHE74_00007276 [Ensete ventricosum]